MHPVLIDFSSFLPVPEFLKLHTYGLMIAVAFLIGMQLGVREARRIDQSKNRDFDVFILDLCFWILISSLAGARLLFIIVNWDDGGGFFTSLIHNIARFFFLSIKGGSVKLACGGGFVFYGGLIGAVLFSIYYSYRRGHDFFLVADVVIPSVALGQFFGRLGCYAAGCCWGKVVSSEYFAGVQFPAGSLAYSSMQHAGQLGADTLHTLHIHPTQLYESIGALTIFFVLHAVRPYKRFHGQVLLVYALLYPILRSTIEMFRGDRERGVYNVIGSLQMSTSQIISCLVALSALSALIYLLRRKARGGAPATA